MILAFLKWRKWGTLRVTLIIEFHDEVFELIYSKRLSKRFVKALARWELARAEDVPMKYVHVTKIEEIS